MTTPTEDEARAALIRNAVMNVVTNAANFPRKVTPHILGQDMGPLGDQITKAVLLASRVSTPPSGTADLRAFAAELRDRYPEDVFAPLSDADHRSVNDALAGRAERTHVTRDRVSADMMRRAATQAIEYADELDDGRATPPTDEDAAALRELVDRGVGFDMTPTFLFDSAEGVYAQWAAYARRIDDAWRERVAAALHPGGEKR